MNRPARPVIEHGAEAEERKNKRLRQEQPSVILEGIDFLVEMLPVVPAVHPCRASGSSASPSLSDDKQLGENVNKLKMFGKSRSARFA
jgi:hypothetical protein